MPGAGGLSEGFIRSNFIPIAHIEIDKAACYTLKTRQVYHWLKKKGKLEIYYEYLKGNLNREELYKFVPREVIDSVINIEINNNTIPKIFLEIDKKLNGNKISLIIGGPPCQAYSLIGRSTDKNKMLGDKRNYLYLQYIKFLDYYKPKYFVFENVTGLLSAKDIDGSSIFTNMKIQFEKIGYKLDLKIMDASDYGILQKRKRVIIIGKRTKNNFKFPDIEKEKNVDIFVNSLFEDLPKLKSGEGRYLSQEYTQSSNRYLLISKIKQEDNNILTYHIARKNNKRDLEIYKLVVENWNNNFQRIKYSDLPKELKTHKNQKSFTDRYKVVEGQWKASHTVVAHISKDGHYYIHPDIDQNRSITPREAARLQTFPDDYFFETVNGKPALSPAFKQIGNAVPVRLSEKIATKLMEVF